MLTKIELDEIMERCERRYIGEHGDTAGRTQRMLDDLLALLKMVSELEDSRDQWKLRCSYWRRNAKALERALLSDNDFTICPACFSCVRYAECNCELQCGKNFSLWKFDMERFAGEEQENG